MSWNEVISKTHTVSCKSNSRTFVSPLTTKISAKSLASIKPLGKPTPKHVTKKIQEAFENRLPLFNICSSKLHRYRYVRRIKSHVNVQIGGCLRRMACKPPISGRKTLRIRKLLPVRDVKLNCDYVYDAKVALPSGLVLETSPGFDSNPFRIRQLYVDKGPQAAGVQDEFSRTFARDGSVLIKKTDGNLTILSSNGSIVHCEIPYIRVKRGSSVNKTDVSNLTDLHINSTSLRKLQKRLYGVINRLHKNSQMMRYASHKQCKAWRKFSVKDAGQIYVLRKNTENWNKFCLVTADGKKLKVTKSNVTEETKYCVLEEMDHRYQEKYTEREDGTFTVLYREGALVAQFPDATRITTWIEIDSNLLYLDETETTPPPGDSVDKTQQVSSVDFLESTSDIRRSNSLASDEIEEVGWVSLHLNVKFEHPNYATVVYYGASKSCEIVLPNNVKLQAKWTGECEITFDEITGNVTKRKIDFTKDDLTVTANLKPKTEFVKVKSAKATILTVDKLGACCSNLTGCVNNKQALFALNRNLSGSRFWSVSDVQNYKLKYDPILTNNRLVNKRVFDKFWRERYLLSYPEPKLVLTKNKSSKLTGTQTAYVTLQILRYLPDIVQFVEMIVELKETQGELGKLLEEVVEKERQRAIDEAKVVSVVVEQKARLDARKVFAQRIESWRNECEKYKNLIRSKKVPCYFAIKADREQAAKELEIQTCQCLHEPTKTASVDLLATKPIPDPAFVVDANSYNSARDSVSLMDKSEENSFLLEGASNLNKVVSVSAKASSIKQPLTEVVKVQSTNVVEVQQAKRELEWPDNALSHLLLDEIKLTLSDYTFLDCNSINHKKVKFLTQKLLCNIRQAVSEYDSDCPLKEFVSTSVIALIDNLKSANPTVKDVERVVKNIENLACTSEENGQEQTSELYKVFNHYASDALKPVYKCKVHSIVKQDEQVTDVLYKQATDLVHKLLPQEQASASTIHEESSIVSLATAEVSSKEDDNLEWYADDAVGVVEEHLNTSMTVLLDMSLLNIGNSEASCITIDRQAFADIDPAENIPVPRAIEKKYRHCSQCQLVQDTQPAKVLQEGTKPEDDAVRSCFDRVVSTIEDVDHATAKGSLPLNISAPHSILRETIERKKSPASKSVGAQTNVKSTVDVGN